MMNIKEVATEVGEEEEVEEVEVTMKKNIHGLRQQQLLAQLKKKRRVRL